MTKADLQVNPYFINTDLYPTEADVEEIIRNVEESAGKGIVKLERFVPYVTKIILDGNLWVLFHPFSE